eukprot:TRINITY_DN1988_c0_g1_i6.p1 TRINITY_DN1988_c0_g1~~TRINITY_DN1988_c0_g1_i6.p1  ORF type:complete len:255 (-),score=74.81 TRINITY_DN1988_c0_g1_i6:425-1123(-)
MKGSHTFQDFKQLWKQRKFSLIHQAKYPELEEREFVSTLFTSTLSFLTSSHTLQLKLGVMYCLYLLYETQLVEPKVNIKVSMYLWLEFLKLYENIKQNLILDAYQIFRKMKREKFFCFTCFIRLVPQSSPGNLSTLEEIKSEMLNREGTLLRAVADVDSIETIQILYNVAKSQALGESLTLSQEISNANPEHQSVVNIINQNLISEMRQLITEFENERSKKVNPNSSSSRRV